MTDHPASRNAPFMRAAAWVGDLGNPFYDEERNRDVWNEASAVGLQVVLWLGLSASVASVWVVGADAVPYVMALYAIIGVASLVTVVYAEHLGVDVQTSERMRRIRMVPYLALTVLLFAGMAVRTSSTWLRGGVATSFESGLADGTVAGYVVGFGLVAGVLALSVRKARSRRDRAEPDRG